MFTKFGPNLVLVPDFGAPVLSIPAIVRPVSPLSSRKRSVVWIPAFLATLVVDGSSVSSCCLPHLIWWNHLILYHPNFQGYGCRFSPSLCGEPQWPWGMPLSHYIMHLIKKSSSVDPAVRYSSSPYPAICTMNAQARGSKRSSQASVSLGE